MAYQGTYTIIVVRLFKYYYEACIVMHLIPNSNMMTNSYPLKVNTSKTKLKYVKGI